MDGQQRRWKTIGWGLLLIRLAAGLLLAVHGAQKLLAFASFAPTVGGTLPAACAVAGELLGGLGLCVGLWTRLAGLGAAVVMGVVAFRVQLAHLPELGAGPGTQFEYPFLLCMVATAFVIMGAGPLSLDARIARRRRLFR